MVRPGWAVAAAGDRQQPLRSVLCALCSVLSAANPRGEGAAHSKHFPPKTLRCYSHAQHSRLFVQGCSVAFQRQTTHRTWEQEGHLASLLSVCVR
jgi:hypothetical protein